MPYITTPGQILKHIYLVDTNQFARKQQTAVFLYWDGNTCLLMDVGTSNDIDGLFQNLHEIGIPKDKVSGIVVTHYHFDHAGGAPELWKKLSKLNSDFTIFVPRDTYHKLQNAESHLIGARTTYGDKVGTIEKLPENAYTIVEKDTFLSFNLANGYQLKLVSVPGHTNDHCAPTLFLNGRAVFCFSGEACGAVCGDISPVLMPTSMPPTFNFEQYMNSCQKIASLSPDIIGFCHFGAIVGKTEIADYLARHQQDMNQFRKIVIKAYKEKPETQYVVKQALRFFGQKGPVTEVESKPNSTNVIFAITFGMMIDLGYRKPKYEQP